MELPKKTCPKCGHNWIPRTPNPQVCPACGTRLQKNDEGLRRPILALKAGSSQGLGYDPARKMVIDANTLIEGDVQRIKDDAIAFKEQVELDRDVLDDFYTLSLLFGQGGRVTLPATTMQAIIAEGTKMNAPQLKQADADFDAQIEKRQEAKQIIADTYTRERLEKGMWDRKPVTFVAKETGLTRAFGVDGLAEIEELLQMAAEMQDALDSRIAFYTKLKQAYNEQLKKLEETEPKATAEKLCEIRAVVKEASDVKKPIVKTTAFFRAKGVIAEKKAVEFSKNWVRFTELRDRYYATYRQISPSSRGIPPFPELSVDEAANSAHILDVAKHAGQFKIPNKLKRGWDY